MQADSLQQLTNAEKAVLNEWAGYFSFKTTWIFSQLLHDESKFRCLFYGNQAGKTAAVAREYVMRIFGVHPIEKRNLRPDNPIRVIRFASQTLPNDAESEVKNTQYPAFKQWLPASLIKKPITFRNPRMVLHDPQGGDDITIEFSGYHQDVQGQAGVQRFSTWLDESAPRSFYDEQIPRLLKADGDLIYTLTPAEFLSWEFEEFFERAHIYYRTAAICARMEERTGHKAARIKTTDSKFDIAVFQAATDDNPTLDIEAINALLESFDDEDVIDIRRYGIFKQVSGMIFKDFDNRIHVLDPMKWFPDGIPHGWLSGRFIDYHEHNPWAVSFMAISPTDEVFIFNEFNPSPEKMVTLEIARQIAHMSGDRKFGVNLVDPLAAKKQPNTGQSVTDDLNRIFYEFLQEGLCTGGYWQSWDTKSTKGRDEIRKRLKNSRLAGKPFNNVTYEGSRKVYLPTIWIFNHCHQTIQSMKSWRREEWTDRSQLVTKDNKDKPQQRWSHFPMCIEAAFKHVAFRAQRGYQGPRQPYKKEFFQGAGR